MKRKNIIKKFGILMAAAMSAFAVCNAVAVPVYADPVQDVTPQVAPDKDAQCASILTSFCENNT